MLVCETLFDLTGLDSVSVPVALTSLNESGTYLLYIPTKFFVMMNY